MNIIESIPYDIWREIFFSIKNQRVYIEQLSSGPASSLRRLSIIDPDTINYATRHLFWVSLVCKALQAIAEEVAYTEVGLDVKRCRKFIETASRKRPNKRQLGEWTKSILLRSYEKDYSYLLGRLIAVCPNAILLSLNTGTEGEIRPKLSEIGRCESLQVLHCYWGQLDWEDFQYISSNCLNLQQLGITRSIKPTSFTNFIPSEPITFPSVRHFGFNIGTDSSGCTLTPFRFPILKRLEVDALCQDARIQSKVREEIDKILQREGTKLVTLEMNFSGFEKPYLGNFGIFNICRNLRTFIVRADSMLAHAQALDNQDAISPHSSLNQLIFVYSSIPTSFLPIPTSKNASIQWEAQDHTPDIFFIPQQAQFFTPERFPNLNSIKLMVWSDPFWKQQHQTAQFKAYVARHFPHLDVEVLFLYQMRQMVDLVCNVLR